MRSFNMKLNNIERNILYFLGNRWLDSGIPGLFDARWIFDKFSDIPDKDMKTAMQSIKEDRQPVEETKSHAGHKRRHRRCRR